MNRKTILLSTLVAGALSLSSTVFGYELTIKTQYTAGCGTGSATVGLCGGPDTGWLSVTNTGTSAFNGSANLSGVAPSQSIDLSIFGLLNVGESWVFNAGPESSNQGGFNKQGGALADLGLKFSITGTADAAIDAFVYDRDIHSGTPATNPFGVTLDNYVLQGGDPFGRDTGDTFEEAQATGIYILTNERQTVAEPGSLALMGLALAGFGARRLRRK